MENRSYVALGVGVIVLIAVLFFMSSVMFLRGGLGAASPSFSTAGGVSASQPTYHVFNFANSMALGFLILLGGVTALVVIARLSEKTHSLLALLLYTLGIIFIFASATIFFFGIHDLISFSGVGETTVQPTFTQQYGWLIESVVFAILGAAGVWGGEFVRKREQETGSLYYLALTPPAMVCALLALGVFLFNMILLTTSSYSEGLEWIIEVLLFSIVALLAFNKIDAMRRERGETQPWRTYPLLGIGYLMALSAFVLFTMTVKLLLDASGGNGTNTAWIIADTAIFALIGFGSFYLADFLEKTHAKEKSALAYPFALIGFLFVLIATITFIPGFDSWIQSNITAADYKASFAWIVETALYGLIGFMFMRASDAMRNTTGLNTALRLSGGLIWLTAFFNFFIAVESLFNPSDSGILGFRVLVHGLVALALLWYADKKGGNVLAKVLAYSGVLLLLFTLLALVLGLHEMLYNTQANADWLVRTGIYVVTGVVLLVVGNYLNPLIKPKTPTVKQKARL
ncbi:MAG: hypothetical protein V1834_00520 [Candidatus Micrarchaeota archaeon]